ncbi:hypothetical protein LJ753_16610 [Arthrobacter sp. zg-Y20]|uniref:hypothetical protein n=1 Tax=unclassified Arthrobacter TaxID=235627 RepID=UPI001D15545B|nr:MULTISPECIES: hypothetical protein [unclassified Arthrobacter]MCC3277487.1 hypothetical protein [Arthrobacter sp. zg-Y20]MDK1317648.1 hypothetical protein [Arthrobacter sp. zg.Y20]WIB07092.1 hypothetical protein QNO06_05010 [Arthrobacter sp. zg-Y20]
MSDYTYTDNVGDILRLLTSADGDRVILIAKGELDAKEIHIQNADAPTVAAELLKAAGHDDLAGLIEVSAAQAKLQARRNAVALSLSGVASYTQQVQTTRKAIDRIIELEDGK